MFLLLLSLPLLFLLLLPLLFLSLPLLLSLSFPVLSFLLAYLLIFSHHCSCWLIFCISCSICGFNTTVSSLPTCIFAVVYTAVPVVFYSLISLQYSILYFMLYSCCNAINSISVLSPGLILRHLNKQAFSPLSDHYSIYS